MFCYFTPLLGAIIADSFLGKFRWLVYDKLYGTFCWFFMVVFSRVPVQVPIHPRIFQCSISLFQDNILPVNHICFWKHCHFHFFWTNSRFSTSVSIWRREIFLITILWETPLDMLIEVLVQFDFIEASVCISFQWIHHVGLGIDCFWNWGYQTLRFSLWWWSVQTSRTREAAPAVLLSVLFCHQCWLLDLHFCHSYAEAGCIMLWKWLLLPIGLWCPSWIDDHLSRLVT